MARRIFKTRTDGKGRVTVYMTPTDREDDAGRDGYSVQVAVDGVSVWREAQAAHCHISSRGIATDSKRAFDMVAETALAFAGAALESCAYAQRNGCEASENADGCSDAALRCEISTDAISYASLDAEHRMGGAS